MLSTRTTCSSNCTGLIVFRDTLINFSEEDIRKLDGTSVADFTLNTITNDLGCVRGDTIQEIGGDILFLGSDGVRFLGATERIGDFSLQLASRTIQDIFTNFINPARQFCSLKIREKNQYRMAPQLHRQQLYKSHMNRSQLYLSLLLRRLLYK